MRIIFQSAVLVIAAFSSLSSFADYFFSEKTTEAVALIDKNLWFQDVKTLASFNRYYRHPNIKQAQDFIEKTFQDIGLTTSLEEIKINNTINYNIIAEIPGKNPDKIYIIGAHYDSISERPMSLAPGAEDNASGTAGLFALARALKAHQPEYTIRFVAFSGEEAGLFGSIKHVENIIKSGDQEKISGVLIMDMIGFSEDDDLDILFETSSANQEIVSLLSASAQKYSTARIETTFNYSGSDHVPFIENGFLTTLIIENDYQNYSDYHRSTDQPQRLNPAMAHEVLKTMMGALGFWVYF